MLGSFLELDGSTDGTIKTRKDVFSFCNLNCLPTPTYVAETSKNHFHVLWIYNNPLPWTERNESFWISQQKRFIKLFKIGGFLVDEGASLNPVQNLRNPSQLNPYNYKRRCEIVIVNTFNKTSLRDIYKALNGTNIPNPKKVKASTKLRHFLRANKTFNMTYIEFAEALGVSVRTAKTEVNKAIQNGDLAEPKKVGNNKGETRTTEYISLVYIEPEEQVSEVQPSIFKTSLLANEQLFRDYSANGACTGYRNKMLFALGLHLKLKKNGNISLDELKIALEAGRCKSCTPEKEFELTLKSALKSRYSKRLSISKLHKWGLIRCDQYLGVSNNQRRFVNK